VDLDFAPLRLVPYAPEHEGGVIALLRACYAEYGQVLELDTLDADLLRISELYAPPTHAFHVLLDEGDRVVGTVCVKRTGPDEGQLKRVFLEAGLRGRGLGKRLTLWAFAWARERGVQRMVFWSDVLFETAHALYEHLGARRTGERRHLGGRNECWEYGFVMEL
jgi:putative acetyltransferase